MDAQIGVLKSAPPESVPGCTGTSRIGLITQHGAHSKATRCGREGLQHPRGLRIEILVRQRSTRRIHCNRDGNAFNIPVSQAKCAGGIAHHELARLKAAKFD